MDINQVGIQDPKGFDDDFTKGYPITELDNNEIEVPYYESDQDCNDTDIEVDDMQYETGSDYTSSDESVVSRRVAVKFHRSRPKYRTMLRVETDFLPE